MDLKEIKKLAQFARRNGILSIKTGDVELILSPSVQAPQRRPRVDPMRDTPTKMEPQAPTLVEINDWIYSQDEEAG